MLIENTFLGVNLEKNLLTSLYEATKIEDNFLTLEDNIVIDIRPSCLLSKENLKAWKSILTDNGQNAIFSKVLENILDFSTSLLNDVKLNAESIHIVAVIAKSILGNKYGYPNAEIKDVSFNTGLGREEKINLLSKAININNMFKFTSLELGKKGKLDEDFCNETYEYKKQVLESEKMQPDFKYTKI